MSKMKRKIQKRLEYTDGGFKVVLENVPMFFFEGEWAPQINISKVSGFIAAKLVLSKQRLTGREFAYLRKYLGRSMRDLAPELDVTYPAICQWEKAGEKETTMKQPTELMFRLLVLVSLGIADTAFRRAYEKLKGGGGCIDREAPSPISVGSEVTPAEFVDECLECA